MPVVLAVTESCGFSQCFDAWLPGLWSSMLLSLQFPAETLIPDGERITWDSRKGFIIANATYREIGLLNCEATVNGHLYQTNYLTHRQSKCRPQGCGHRAQSFELHPASEILIFNFFFPLLLTANTILDVRVSPPSPVRLLRGQTLVLNCTATTELNTRVQMSWNYPGRVSGRFSSPSSGRPLSLL